MNGGQMMLKSFGVDPEVIKAELTGVLTSAQTAVTTEVDKLRKDIAITQRSLNRIELMLEAILKEQGIGIGGGLDTSLSEVNHSGEADQVLMLKG